MSEPERMLDTEVAVLIEMEMVEEGVCNEEVEVDWASTAVRKASPRRRRTARERGWRRPTMTVVVDKEVSWVKTDERSGGETNGDKGLNESDGRRRFNGNAGGVLSGYLLWYTRSPVDGRGRPGRGDAGRRETDSCDPQDRPWWALSVTVTVNVIGFQNPSLPSFTSSMGS